jgi:hypothetical protein
VYQVEDIQFYMCLYILIPVRTPFGLMRIIYTSALSPGDRLGFMFVSQRNLCSCQK